MLSIYYQFAGLNDKRFYSYDGIVYMPFADTLIEKLRKEKKKETNIILQAKEKKEDYINAEAKAVRQFDRLQILRCCRLLSYINLVQI